LTLSTPTARGGRVRSLQPELCTPAPKQNFRGPEIGEGGYRRLSIRRCSNAVRGAQNQPIKCDLEIGACPRSGGKRTFVGGACYVRFGLLCIHKRTLLTRSVMSATDPSPTFLDSARATARLEVTKNNGVRANCGVAVKFRTGVPDALDYKPRRSGPNGRCHIRMQYR